jgi:hypothetical protein
MAVAWGRGRLARFGRSDAGETPAAPEWAAGCYAHLAPNLTPR